MIGYLQQQIIDIGEVQGYITLGDVRRIYPSGDIKLIMNKLCVQGYFTEAKKDGFVIWLYGKNKLK